MIHATSIFMAETVGNQSDQGAVENHPFERQMENRRRQCSRSGSDPKRFKGSFQSARPRERDTGTRKPV